MRQYTFKDGTKVIASSVEEAKSKHKVMAAKKEAWISMIESIGFKKDRGRYHHFSKKVGSYIAYTPDEGEQYKNTLLVEISECENIDKLNISICVYPSINARGGYITQNVVNESELKETINKVMNMCNNIIKDAEKLK